MVVSVPLRGKEGAGPEEQGESIDNRFDVSVPLRGKEGAGLGIENPGGTIRPTGFRPLAG